MLLNDFIGYPVDVLQLLASLRLRSIVRTCLRATILHQIIATWGCCIVGDVLDLPDQLGGFSVVMLWSCIQQGHLSGSCSAQAVAEAGGRGRGRGTC